MTGPSGGGGPVRDLASCREAGAYALVLRLYVPASLPVPKPGGVLAPGVYVYFGGAYGPGGLAARLGRHLRGGGRRHWHVDHLRAEAEVLGAAVWPGGGECAWRAAVQDTGGAGVPWPRFGSSDCRRCPAHLLSLDETVEPVAAVVRLGVRAARSHLGDGPTKDVSPDQKGRWPHAISAHDGPHP